jgi:hypothetical protein
MLLEDCPAYPMQFFLRLRFLGRFERDAFTQAFDTALARHPLLMAVVERRARHGCSWVLAEEIRPEIRWQIGPLDEGLPAANVIDIYREPGLRATVVEDRERSDVTLQFQHTACDGLGASDFAADLLTAYANRLTTGDPYRLKRIDVRRLTTRGAYPTRWQLAKWMARHALELPRLWQFYKRRPVVMVSPLSQGETAPAGDYPACFFYTFATEDSQRMHRAAHQAGTTLNSVLLRDIFLTLRDERPPGVSAGDHDILRVTMPVNVRTAADRTMPAANLVSLLCLDRALGQIHDEFALLTYIDAAIEHSQRDHGEWLLPAALRLMQHFPKQLSGVLRRKRFAGTTFLSNIGPALPHCHLPRTAGKLVAGNVTLEQVEFLPVLRDHHGVSFGATTYGGAITIGMHFDSRRVPRTQAATIFQRLVHQVAGSSSTPAAQDAYAA